MPIKGRRSNVQINPQSRLITSSAVRILGSKSWRPSVSLRGMFTCIMGPEQAVWTATPIYTEYRTLIADWLWRGALVFSDRGNSDEKWRIVERMQWKFVLIWTRLFWASIAGPKDDSIATERWSVRDLLFRACVFLSWTRFELLSNCKPRRTVWGNECERNEQKICRFFF